MKNKVIAAVRSREEWKAAMESAANTVFLLAPNIEALPQQAKEASEAGKKLFIHMDLAEGLGKDEYGIRYAKGLGIAGIISTRANIIKAARKLGLATVQRFFIVDSQSIRTSVESAKSAKPDMIEIMPGTVGKVIARLKEELPMPIVAGGLIESAEEIAEALLCGAEAISTGKQEFWGEPVAI